MAQLKIALTNRLPVEIDEEKWPIIATHSAWTLKRNQELTVRTDGNGTYIVYGIDHVISDKCTRAGKIVEGLDKVPAAINFTGMALDFPTWLADACMQKLPAVTL